MLCPPSSVEKFHKFLHKKMKYKKNSCSSKPKNFYPEKFSKFQSKIRLNANSDPNFGKLSWINFLKRVQFRRLNLMTQLLKTSTRKWTSRKFPLFQVSTSQVVHLFSHLLEISFNFFGNKSTLTKKITVKNKAKDLWIKT